jgi:predicted nucleic acid-binding protein
MTVVIDCNIFVVCLTSRSPYHYIYRSLIEGKFDLLISDEILLEYEEIVQIKYRVTAGCEIKSSAAAFVKLSRLATV